MGNKLFVFNGASFESELRTPGANSSNSSDDPLGLSACLLPLGSSGDRVLVDRSIPGEFLQVLQNTGLSFALPIPRGNPLPPRIEHLVPWGASVSMSRLASSLGLSFFAPDLKVVCWANSKQTSHQLESEFDRVPDGSRLITSTEEAHKALQDAPHDNPQNPFLWVFKSVLGVAGRDRSLGRGRKLLPTTRKWIETALRRDSLLLFEPWVDVEREFSVQMEIALDPETSDPKVQLLGTTELLTGTDGRYLGNRVGSLLPVPQSTRLHQVAHQVGCRLASRGYWGPVGIDAFLSRKAEETNLRPLVEINARFTMGRVALQMIPLLPPSGIGTWILTPSNRSISLPPYDPNTRIGLLACSPETTAKKQRQALFFSAQNPQDLAEAEKILLP